MTRIVKSLLSLVFLLTFSNATMAQGGFGRVQMSSNADTLYLWMETVMLKVSTSDTIDFPVGDYLFDVTAKGFKNRKLRLWVKEGELILTLVLMEEAGKVLRSADRGSYPYLDWGKTLHVETDTDSWIEVNGLFVGTGQWMGLADSGRVELSVKNPYGRSRTMSVWVNSNRLLSVDMHLRMSRREHMINSLIPGLSPYRKQQVVRMVASPLLVGALVQQSISHHLTYLDLRQDYYAARKTYRNAPPAVADEFAAIAQRKADQANDMYRRRNLVYGLTVAGYVLTYLDGIRPGAIGYRQGGMRLDPYLEPNPNGDGLLPAFRFAKSF